MRAGAQVKVPGLDGRVSVWSPADEGPGSYFAVPVDERSPYKYVVIRATMRATEPEPVIELLRTERKVAS